MDNKLKNRLIEVCDKKISEKGEGVGLSFYAFFKNKNTEPDTLMAVARWWIVENKLDHFEKAMKIKSMLKNH